MIGGVSGSNYGALASTGIRPSVAPGTAPVEPIAPVARRRDTDLLDNAAAGREDPRFDSGPVTNTAPTEVERQVALDSGRTRGSFVDIRV